MFGGRKKTLILWRCGAFAVYQVVWLEKRIRICEDYAGVDTAVLWYIANQL